jgi:hypothetical protein
MSNECQRTGVHPIGPLLLAEVELTDALGLIGGRDTFKNVSLLKRKDIAGL